jgi:hypothetical protein
MLIGSNIQAYLFTHGVLIGKIIWLIALVVMGAIYAYMKFGSSQPYRGEAQSGTVTIIELSLFIVLGAFITGILVGVP